VILNHPVVKCRVFYIMLLYYKRVSRLAHVSDLHSSFITWANRLLSESPPDVDIILVIFATLKIFGIYPRFHVNSLTNGQAKTEISLQIIRIQMIGVKPVDFNPDGVICNPRGNSRQLRMDGRK
jgi:hypothetical protein